MTAPAVSITVADAVWEQIKSSRSASDDHLSMNLERATRIVDQGGVRKVSAAPSGRSFFLVVGESKRKEEYICFPEHHCTCYSFFYDCKHQIAARLAEAVGEVVEVEVSDEQLATMLSKL
ncbi:hypothetical protein BHE74_00016741 [Ensete ventricosum]|nr:hypothetical protein BHE74_00016741 [Ensete ventricosum]